MSTLEKQNDYEFHLRIFEGVNKDSSKKPAILDKYKYDYAVLINKYLKEEDFSKFAHPFPTFKLLRTYTDDDLEHGYIINVIAERPHPNGLGDKIVICEWIEGYKIEKFSINIEKQDTNEPRLCDGENY